MNVPIKLLLLLAALPLLLIAGFALISERDIHQVIAAVSLLLSLVVWPIMFIVLAYIKRTFDQGKRVRREP